MPEVPDFIEAPFVLRTKEGGDCIVASFKHANEAVYFHYVLAALVKAFKAGDVITPQYWK